MFVPDEVRKCVVYVGYRDEAGNVALRGTAFFVGRSVPDVGMFSYLVTAGHLIKKMKAKKWFDGKIILRMNLSDGITAKDFEIDIEEWKFHPTEDEVDVAVLPHMWRYLDQLDLKTISVESFLDDSTKVEHEISIGDELFLTGLFYNHRGRRRNIPIVRVGNIAAMCEEKVHTDELGFIDAYLIEARSIGGLSGSPVFVTVEHILEKDHFLTGTGEREKKSFYLLGLMHGHYDVDLLSEEVTTTSKEDAKTIADEVVNMGIAIVIPSEKIMEVITQPAIREPELTHEKKLRGLTSTSAESQKLSQPSILNA